MLPLLFGLGSGLGLQGMPGSLVFWEWGCPKRVDAHITVTALKNRVRLFFDYLKGRAVLKRTAK